MLWSLSLGLAIHVLFAQEPPPSKALSRCGQDEACQAKVHLEASIANRRAGKTALADTQLQQVKAKLQGLREGVAAARRADPAKAIQLLDSAVDLERSMGAGAVKEEDLRTLGSLHAAKGRIERDDKDLEQAGKSFNAAIVQFQSAGDVSGEARATALLATTRTTADKRAADHLARRSALLGAASNDVPAQAAALKTMADARGSGRDAAFLRKRAISMVEASKAPPAEVDADLKSAFGVSTGMVYRETARDLVEQGRFAEMVDVLDRLKVQELRHVIDPGVLSRGELKLAGAEAAAARKWEEVSSGLATLATERARLLKKPKKAAGDDQRLQELDRELTTRGEGFDSALGEVRSAPPAAVTPEAFSSIWTVLEDLPGSVALYSAVLEDRTMVALISPGETTAFYSKVGAKEVRSRVQKLRAAIRDRSRLPLAEARAVYEVLFPPGLEDALKRLHATTLVWSLDGVLRYVPLPALHDGRGFLVDRFAQVTLTPGTYFRVAEARKAQWTALAAGVSDAPAGYSPLPEVVNELSGLVGNPPARRGILAGAPLLNSAFTRDGLVKQLEQPRDVLHIATHYAFSPAGGSGSYLLLGDGTRLPLTDFEQITKKARARFQLVTLSACESGLARDAAVPEEIAGVEVEGLANIAQRNGAAAVLATLWSVADRSTAELLVDFYRRREGPKGLSKAAALQQAQKAMLHGEVPREAVAATGGSGAAGEAAPRGCSCSLFRIDEGDEERGGVRVGGKPEAPGGFTHPFYWAPFVLVGNWQ